MVTAVAFEKLVLVTRKTRLQELVERLNSRGQAKFYIEHAGGDFSDYEREDDAYRHALATLRKELNVGLKLHAVDRWLVPTCLFTKHDLIVTLGQDGLVANVAKYVGEQPVVAVNPQPERFDGILLPFVADQARAAVQRVLDGTATERRVTLAEVDLNDGQTLTAFNDFYIGQKTHFSSRYKITLRGQSEAQSSSGVIVSTGAGSTGWMSSVYHMAAGVSTFAGGTPGRMPKLDWEDRRLLFAVREPFLSRHSKISIAAGLIESPRELVIESLMPQNGVIFGDGVESDFIEFTSGKVARIRAAKRQARLVT